MVRPMTCASVAALGFSVLAACSTGTTPAGDTTTEASTTTAAPVASSPPPTGVTEPTTVTKQWVDLTVGECVAQVPAVEVGEATVTVVDCATPHRAEVYLLAPVAVDAAIADVADRACAAGVDGYTGGRPGLAITYLVDSKQDRTGAIPLPSTVICLLQSGNGESLVGTVHE